MFKLPLFSSRQPSASPIRRSALFAGLAFFAVISPAVADSQATEPAALSERSAGQDGPMGEVEASPLRIAIGEDIPCLDPHQHLSTTGFAVLGNIFESLVCPDRENRPQPCLAERWQHEDSRVWRFFLRPKARFHNGKTVTVEDVAFSLERARRQPESQVSSFLVAVKSVVADPSTHSIEIELERSDLFFLESLSMVAVVPADSPAKIVDPIGTGPYRLLSYEPEVSLRLGAFAQSWQGQTNEPEVEFLIVPNPEKAVALLERGDVDLAVDLPPKLVSRVEARSDLWVESRLSQSLIFLGLDPRRPPFDDPSVRQALDLALDRSALMEGVSLNHARPASQMLAPSILGHSPEIEPATRDLNRAKELIAKTGRRPAFTIETTDNFVEHAGALAAQLEEAGFKVEVAQRPWPELYADLFAGKLKAWLGTWTFDSTDGAVFFNTIVHSKTADGLRGSSSLANLEDPALDAAIRDAVREPDLKAREKKLQELSRLWTERRIHIPILWPLDLYGTRRSFEWHARKDKGLKAVEMSRRAQPAVAPAH